MVRTKYRTFLTHMVSNYRAQNLEKSSGRLLATNCRNIVTSLYNVTDTAHSMVPSIRFDCLKKSQTEVDINNYYLEVNWPWLCDLAHEKFALTLNLNLNHREIWSPK